MVECIATDFDYEMEHNYDDIYDIYYKLFPDDITSDFIMEEDGPASSVEEAVEVNVLFEVHSKAIRDVNKASLNNLKGVKDNVQIFEVTMQGYCSPVRE